MTDERSALSCTRFTATVPRSRGLVALGAAALALAMSEPRSALAEQAPTAAAEHFDRAMEHVENREFELAIQDFQRAYALEPNAVVLYNLAQVYATAGRPLDALRTLYRCLEEGGSSVLPAREARIKKLIAQEEAKLGMLKLWFQPADAEALLDSESVVALPDGRVPVAPGEHHLMVRAPGHVPHSQQLIVKAGDRATLDVRLERVEAERSIRVRCPVRNTQVLFDGTALRSIPGGNQVTVIDVPSRAQVIGFRHAGYTEHYASLVSLSDDSVVDCGLEQVPTAPSRSFAENVPHARSNSRAGWTIALAGTGVGLGLSAGLIWVYNGARAEEWRSSRTRAGLCESGGTAVPCDDPGAELTPAQRDVLGTRDSIERWDKVSMGLAIGSLLALGGSAALTLWPEDPERPVAQSRTQLIVTPNTVEWRGAF